MIGLIFNGKYKVTEKLGTGGSGEVYKAYHVRLGTPWALKVISTPDHSTLSALEILKNLNHPAFPRLVDVISEESKAILIFDYYEGLTLQQVLEQQGQIDEKKAIGIAEQILDALSYLHGNTPEPIIYRDLKPSNLMLLPDNSIKLIDFGTARLFKRNRSDDTIYLGTPGYAAPEQFGAGQTDVRTDIYNFGMTLFHLVTGKHPLQCGESQFPQILSISGISKNLSAIILKCISRDPAYRYSSIEEIQKAINADSRRKVTQQILKVMGKNAVEISVSGVQSGVGVTHFCMLFGMWLKSQGFRTAVLEYCENRDTMSLCRLIEKENQLRKNGFFQIHGLSVFPHMDKEKIDGFQRAEYDYILLDYGVHDEYISMMARRCDVKIVMAPGADWKLGALGSFLSKYKAFLNDPNTYVGFPLQNAKSIHIIQSWFRLPNMLTIPCVINPWKTERSEKQELKLIYAKLFQADRRLEHAGKRREL